MRRNAIVLATVVAAVAAWAPGAQAATVKAGVAAVDASWHVGASAGQYASDGTAIRLDQADPHTHSTRREPSYGVQSRLQVRAIVIQGPNGKRIAIVKNDLYIPQDLLYRRTAHLLEEGDSGITRETLTIPVSHNHSSPYYSTPSWGVWAFQDVFDVRFYEYYAKRMALAVERAAERLVPVRVGASVNYFDKTHKHSFRGAVADDGTPAGYPTDDTDHDMTVVRFDDISDPGDPKPLANIVNFGLHPEFLSGNDLISGDYVAPLERIVDRRTGALTIFSQSATGTSEIERSTYHSIHDRLEFDHREYGQSEYGARLMANSIIDAWRDIERRTPAYPDRFVPFDSNFHVAMEDRWFPGPLSHPYPGVSSCRTDAGFGGDPRVPVVGLPDCVGALQGPRTLADFAGFPEPPTPEKSPVDPGVSTDDLQAAGIPVPENYSAPSYTGLEEDVSVHLQAFRLGEILFTVCPCEQWADQDRNIETRTNRRQGDQYLGYDWTSPVQNAPDQKGPINRPHCVRRPDGNWTCPDPTSKPSDLRRKLRFLGPLTDHQIRRMRAQVLNDAKGWNDPSYLPYAESEPVDTTKIKGNFTHDELPASQGYMLTIPIGMANDYNGYIASYREYQRGDHYRKALSGWGPHSSDYMATRLVGMGGHLNGGPPVPDDPGQEKVPPDLALNDQKAANLGRIGDTSLRTYEARLPDDGGPVVATQQPKDLERFGAAFFSWNGGSNFTDNPDVVVQRYVRGRWEDFADQSGEVQTTLKYPQGSDLPSYLTGGFRWRWTAHFEAFASNFDTGGTRATPPSSFRFVVRGRHRHGGEAEPYQLVSRKFKVRPWDEITVEDIRLGRRSGRVSFRLGPRSQFQISQHPEKAGAPEDDEEPLSDEEAKEAKPPALEAEVGPIDYPDSYKSPARFIGDRRTFIRDPEQPNDTTKLEWFCFTCSFRPWADTGDGKKVYVTFIDRDGDRHRVRARKARRGRWVARRRVCRGQSALVRVKQVRDKFGNYNGQASPRVTGSRRACASQRRRAERRRARFPAAPRFTG